MNIFTIISIFFLLSGATALIYEVIWVRLLALTFGNTVYAIGVVLTAFMSGLSIGSFLLGKYADKKGVNLLKTYGYLEIGIALFAVLSPELLNAVTFIYLSIFSSEIPVWLLSVYRYALSIVVLLLPTILMGGTLPVLSRFFIRSESELERKVGSLYSINTMGGVLGTFLVGFIFLRFFGLNVTLRSTAVLNVLIGLTSLYLGKTYSLSEETEDKGKLKNKKKSKSKRKDKIMEESPAQLPGYHYALIAFFLSGFSAMVYQIAWSRLLVSIIGSTTYAFSMILMGFLLGIGLGSYVVSLLSRSRRFNLFHFSIIEISIGLICFLSILFFKVMPELMFRGLAITGPSFTGVLTLEFLLVLVFLLVPTTLFGATFPIIAGVYSSGPEHRGQSIGSIYASNTTGAIFGSALAAFLFLPWLGSAYSIKVAAVINILVGTLGFTVLRKPIFAVCSSLFLLILFLPVNIPQKLLDSGVAIYGLDSNYLLKQDASLYLYQKEGLHATISVTATDSGNLSFKTNGKVDAGTSKDMSTQLALGYFPLLLHPDARDVLVVGVGSGITVKAVRDFQNTNIDAVEIEPAVIEAARYFEMFNGGIMNDPDINFIIDDARSFMTVTEKQYDVIISEPSNPWISGIGSLFTKEFYQLSAEKMNKGGIFCQWLHLYGLRGEDLQMILKTFNSVFEHASIWHSHRGDILLIGSKQPFQGYDYQSVAEEMTGVVGIDLKVHMGISDPLDFFSFFVTDTGGVRKIAGDAPLNTDDLPLLEFNAPYSMYKSETTLSNNIMLFKNIRFPKISGIDYNRDFEAAFLYRKSKNYAYVDLPTSSSWINSALKQSPSNNDYLVEKARGLARTGKYPEAFDILQQVVASAPDNASAHFETGLLLNLRKDFEKAGFHLDKAASLNPDEFQFVHELALHRLKEKDYRAALTNFSRAYKLPHNKTYDGPIFFRMGQCIYNLGDAEKALKYFNRSSFVNPFNPIPLYTSGDIYLQKFKKPDVACKLYRNALLKSSDAMKKAIQSRVDKHCRNKY